MSSGEVLSEKIERLKDQNATLSLEREELERSKDEEKETLLNALEESRIKSERLEAAKLQLEERLARDLENIRGRESSLESKIEIMKLEQSVLQKEKDKIIIDLKREAHKMEGHGSERSGPKP